MGASGSGKSTLLDEPTSSLDAKVQAHIPFTNYFNFSGDILISQEVLN